MSRDSGAFAARAVTGRVSRIIKELCSGGSFVEPPFSFALGQGRAKHHASPPLALRFQWRLLAPTGLDRQQFQYPLCAVELTKCRRREIDAIDPFQTFGIAARSSQKQSLTEFKFKARNFGFSFGP